MAFHPLLVIYVAALGLIVGSYLNVVIHRLPRRESTVLPRSRCPFCGSLIRAWDNLPVVSWVLLRGRCRDCHSPIAVRYPMVEAATSGLFLLCLYRFGVTPGAGVAVLFCCLMVVLWGIDLDHLILPDRITLPGVVLGLALQPWITWVSFKEAVVGVVLGAGLLLAANGLWYLWRRVEAMGLGDVKMLAMVGAFLGWKGVLVSLFVGALAGTLVALPALLQRRLGTGHRLPFGPFLAFGALVGLFTAGGLVDAYLGYLGWP